MHPNHALKPAYTPLYTHPTQRYIIHSYADANSLLQSELPRHIAQGADFVVRIVGFSLIMLSIFGLPHLLFCHCWFLSHARMLPGSGSLERYLSEMETGRRFTLPPEKPEDR